MDNNDILMDDSSDEEEDDDEKNLSYIFEDAYATTYITDDGKKRWRCEWCKKDFAGWNATKALLHLIQKKKVDIAPCQVKISQESTKRYMKLFTKKKDKEDSTKRRRDSMERSIESKHVRAAVSLESSKKKCQAALLLVVQ